MVRAAWPDRTKARLITWLTNNLARLRGQIHTVGAEMWDTDVTAIREVVPRAMLVIDRFPGAQHSRDSADTLR